MYTSPYFGYVFHGCADNDSIDFGGYKGKADWTSSTAGGQRIDHQEDRDAGAYDAAPGAEKANHEGKLGSVYVYSGNGSRYVTRHPTAHPANPHPPFFLRLTLHGWELPPRGTKVKDEGCHARTLTWRMIYVSNGIKQWGTWNLSLPIYIPITCRMISTARMRSLISTPLGLSSISMAVSPRFP